MTAAAILGIDIAKDTFDVLLLQGEQRQAGQFSNDPAGFKQLNAWLRKRKCSAVRACLEATGHYGDELAEFLFAAQHTVSVVNPLAIKSYGQSKLRRNKNDKLDAELIAHYCRSEQPPPWSPPAPEIRALRELVHQYDNLQAARTQARNRLQAGLRSEVVREQLQAQLALIEQQIADLKHSMQAHIDQFPDLKQQRELLQSIPGIGVLTTTKIVAVAVLRFDSARSLAAYAGLTPMNRSSGSSVHRPARLSKLGNASLRRAFYMPSIVAIRHNPCLKQFYLRLLAKGKTKLAALGAVMHKLLRLAYGVLKSGQAFDPNYAANTKREKAAA